MDNKDEKKVVKPNVKEEVIDLSSTKSKSLQQVQEEFAVKNAENKLDLKKKLMAANLEESKRIIASKALAKAEHDESAILVKARKDFDEYRKAIGLKPVKRAKEEGYVDVSKLDKKYVIEHVQDKLNGCVKRMEYIEGRRKRGKASPVQIQELADLDKEAKQLEKQLAELGVEGKSKKE